MNHSVSETFTTLHYTNPCKVTGGSGAEWLVHVGLTIQQSRVPLWRLTGFVLGGPEFKSSATLVNSQLVASCQLGFLTLLCCI